MPEVTFLGKPDAGNPHVRFDEGEGLLPSLLYNVDEIMKMAALSTRPFA